MLDDVDQKELTEEEVRMAFKKLKTAGLDRIQAEMLKNSDEDVIVKE
mgnify:CR=1 FL=1